MDSNENQQNYQRMDETGEGRDGGDDRRRGGKPPGGGGRHRKRVLDTRTIDINYKNSELERFISRTGKILPRRMTGATAKVQRKIAREIKTARMINLLPFSRR